MRGDLGEGRHFAHPQNAGRGYLGWGTGADGLRVPATRFLPGHVLAAPSVVNTRPLSPTLPCLTEG